MSRLERRYRRILRLLPAEHRRSRGEELLGLLLDLDEGRDRPSPRQVIGLLGLALRLRLLPAASLLLAAFLIADGTSAATFVYQVASGAMEVTVADSFPLHNVTVVVLITALLRIGTAVAWILGARRMALALFAIYMSTQMLPSVLDGLGLHDLLILAVLAPAVLCRWPRPRPRVVLLTATALAIPLWLLIGMWSRHGISYDLGHPPLALAPALGAAALGAVIAGALARHRRRPAVITIMTIGALGGAALPTTVPRLLYSSTNGWLLCVTAGIALLSAAAAGRPSADSHADGANQTDRHTPATT